MDIWIRRFRVPDIIFTFISGGKSGQSFQGYLEPRNLEIPESFSLKSIDRSYVHIEFITLYMPTFYSVNMIWFDPLQISHWVPFLEFVNSTWIWVSEIPNRWQILTKWVGITYNCLTSRLRRSDLSETLRCRYQTLFITVLISVRWWSCTFRGNAHSVMPTLDNDNPENYQVWRFRRL